MHDHVVKELSERVENLENELANTKGERDRYLSKLNEVTRVFDRLPSEFKKTYIQERKELREENGKKRDCNSRGQPKPPKPNGSKH